MRWSSKFSRNLCEANTLREDYPKRSPETFLSEKDSSLSRVSVNCDAQRGINLTHSSRGRGRFSQSLANHSTKIKKKTNFYQSIQLLFFHTQPINNFYTPAHQCKIPSYTKKWTIYVLHAKYLRDESGL